MCLGVPGKVLQVDGFNANVDFWGLKRNVRLETVDEPVKKGDYVLVHVGFAIRRIPEDQVQETLALYDELMSLADRDLMAADVHSEVDATGKTKKEEP